jgi:hypothetical protein
VKWFLKTDFWFSSPTRWFSSPACFPAIAVNMLAFFVTLVRFAEEKITSRKATQSTKQFKQNNNNITQASL